MFSKSVYMNSIAPPYSASRLMPRVANHSAPTTPAIPAATLVLRASLSYVRSGPGSKRIAWYSDRERENRSDGPAPT